MNQDYLNKEVDLNDPNFANVFDETSLWSAYFGKILLENIPLKRDQSVLDVGCGNGFPLFEIAHQLGSSSKVVGVDIWEDALQRAKFKKAFYDLKNVSIVKADASNMPFDNESFDLITSNLGINNFEHPQKSLDECFRVLKKGGEILITTNTVGHMNLFYRSFEKTLTELDLNDLVPALKKQEAHRKTVLEIKGLFQKSKFTISNVIENHLTLRYLDGTAFLNHSLTIFGFLDGWKNILKEDQQKEVFKHLERQLNEIATEKGELQMNIPMLLIHAKKD